MPRTPTKYLQDKKKYILDINKISPNHSSNINWIPIKYLQDTQKIPKRHPLNMSRTSIKYIHNTNKISPGHH